MTVIEAIIMGVLQGVTEFLPISSSGHLVIGQALLGIHIPGKAIEVVVHVGTLLSILVVFKGDWIHLVKTLTTGDSRKYILFIVIGTIPAAVAGILFEEALNQLFENVLSVGIALWVTGGILLITWFLPERKKEISLWKAVLIGCSQAAAIIPGISRSGTTITTGLALGLEAVEAARFSFLLAVPAIGGAALLTGIESIQNPTSGLDGVILVAALASSFVAGIFALKWLLKLVSSGRLYWFSAYCFLLGCTVLIWG